MPSKKECDLVYLQDITEGRKIVFLKDEIPTLQADKGWPEYAVKHAWPQVKNVPGINKFFPESFKEGKFKDRKFFWGIIEKIMPEWAKSYRNKVIDQ